MSINISPKETENFAPPYDSDAHRTLIKESWELVKGVSRSRETAGRTSEWKNIENGLWKFKSVADLSGLERDDRAVVLDLFEDMLHFPVMAGMIQTALAVFWGMFTSQRPIFEVNARERNDVLGAKLMQLRLDYEVDMRKLLLRFLRLVYEGMVYGFGVVSVDYTREMKTKTRWRTTQYVDPITEELINKSGRVSEPYVAYEGNIIENVSPYNFGSDWRYPAHEIQRGSFVFHRTIVHIDELIERKDFKNVDKVKEYSEHSNTGDSPMGLTARQGEDRDLQLDPSTEERLTTEDRKSKYIELFRFQRKIIPKNKGYTESTARETWEFYITDSGVCLAAWPLDNDHGDFTYAAWAAIPFEELSYPPSIAEMLRPMQDEINWLVNSNRISVRRSMNGWWIYDPKFIDETQLKPARFMKFIKLLRSLPQGMSQENVLRQIAYADPTQQNLASITPLLDAMKQATGITDMLQGIPFSSRRTATEAQSVTQYAVTRLQLIAGIMAISAMSDIARQMVANNQQYAREDIWMRLGGDTYAEVRAELAKEGKTLDSEYLRISPAEIAGTYDFPAFSPEHPSSTPAKVEGLSRIFQELIRVFPALQQTGYEVDFGLLSREFGQVLGIKNMGDIIKKAQGAPSVEQFMGGGNGAKVAA